MEVNDEEKNDVGKLYIIDKFRRTSYRSRAGT